MDAETQRIVETVIGFVAGFVIGLPMLLFGRRLFWLLGGLALATLFLTVVILVIAFAVITRYPALLEALNQAIQNPEASPVSSAALSEVAEEALNTFADSMLQLGALVLIVTLIGGIVGALILIRFPRAASTLVGFVGGIYLLLLVFELYSVGLPGWLNALLAIAAGIVVAIIARRNPDTSLIVLSTVIATSIIVTGLKFDPYSSLSAILTLGLMLIGIIYQTSALHRRQAKMKAKTALARE